MGVEAGLSEDLCESLRQKCRENRWLASTTDAADSEEGQNPPSLEFHYASSMNELESFFESGKKHLGEAIVFKNTAFIQQVDLGDEWWVVHRNAQGTWTEIDSVSIGPLIELQAFKIYLNYTLWREQRNREEEQERMRMTQMDEQSLAERASRARAEQERSSLLDSRDEEERGR